MHPVSTTLGIVPTIVGIVPTTLGIAPTILGYNPVATVPRTCLLAEDMPIHSPISHRRWSTVSLLSSIAHIPHLPPTALHP